MTRTLDGCANSQNQFEQTQSRFAERLLLGGMVGRLCRPQAHLSNTIKIINTSLSIRNLQTYCIYLYLFTMFRFFNTMACVDSSAGSISLREGILKRLHPSKHTQLLLHFKSNTRTYLLPSNIEIPTQIVQISSIHHGEVGWLPSSKPHSEPQAIACSAT